MTYKIEKRMQWHPACFAALNLEFLDNKEDLKFLQEQVVNDLPLRIDALVIKKNKNSVIQNEIGKLFRWYNLVEYKSPDDELSFNDFLKGVAEVYLFKGKKKNLNLESISLTFVRARKPSQLFKILERYQFHVNQKFLGIYYISGRNIVPIQIIVSRELNKESHIWLNSLAKKLSLEQAKELVKSTNELHNSEDKKFADALWEIVTRANKELVEKMREEKIMCKAMAEIFKPEIDAAVEAAVAEAVAEVKESAFSEGFNDGFNDGFSDGFSDGTDDKGIKVFTNMIKKGFSKEDAQAITEISDALVEKALAMCC